MDGVDRYLLRAAGFDPGAPHRADWEQIAARTIEERLLPQVWAAVQGDPSAPAAIRSYLQEQHALSSVRALLIKHELLRITRALTQAEIDSSPLKGVALAHRLYGDAAMRQCGDLDLLVHPGDRTEALAVLQQLGYVQDRPFDEAHDHHTYLHKTARQTTINLELHTGVNWNNRPYFPAPWWEARVPLEVDGTTLRIFRDDHLLIYLCEHVATHGFAAWGWLVDIAALLGRRTFSWDAVVAHCRELGLERPVYYTLDLLRRLKGASVEQGVLDQLRPRRDLSRPVWFLLNRGPRQNPRLPRLTAAITTGSSQWGSTRDWFIPSYHAFVKGHPGLSQTSARLLYVPWLIRGALRAAAALSRAGIPARRI